MKSMMSLKDYLEMSSQSIFNLESLLLKKGKSNFFVI